MQKYMDRPSMSRANKEHQEAMKDVEEASALVRRALDGEGKLDEALDKLREAREHLRYLERNL